uniref:hypothetical protein n=1 Tax=Serratia quinivorans TaxID=137545 RepID=UPI00404769C9
MHRIDTPTAQIDKFGQGKNGFTNGDPSTGRRATDLNSDMWDAVQEEIANAIESTGITLDKSKHNQLYQAIQKAITDPGFLKKANNLSDVEDVAEARGNLELGSAATKNVGTEGGNVMQVGAFGLGRGPIAKTDAYSNIAQFYRVDDRATNKPPITGTSAGVICLPIDGAPTASYLAISGKGEFWIGSSTTAANGIIKWSRVYTTAYKPTAADVGAVASVNGSASRLKVTDELSINGNVLYKDNGGLWFNVSDQYFGFEPNGSMTTPSIKILDSLNMGAATRIYLDKDDLIINATENYFIFRKNGDYVAPKVFEGTARVYSPNNPQPPNTAWANVGSYAYAMWGGTGNVNFNEIVSGSNLYPSGSAGSAGGASLPGSWRCMGIATTVNDAFRSTLWVRVS